MNHDEKNSTTCDAVASWKRDVMLAAMTGGCAAIVTAAATYLVGRVTESEARVLVEAILPTSRFLCSAAITATATILALMLTLLGISVRSDQDLDDVFYERIKQIAFYDMVVLVTSVCFLVVHCIPITKSDSIPRWWYSSVYYTQLTISALIGGAIVCIVVMLYQAVRDVIRIFGLQKDANSADQRREDSAGDSLAQSSA